MDGEQLRVRSEAATRKVPFFFHSKMPFRAVLPTEHFGLLQGSGPNHTGAELAVPGPGPSLLPSNTPPEPEASMGMCGCGHPEVSFGKEDQGHRCRQAPGCGSDESSGSQETRALWRARGQRRSKERLWGTATGWRLFGLALSVVLSTVLAEIACCLAVYFDLLIQCLRVLFFYVLKDVAHWEGPSFILSNKKKVCF